MRHEENVQQLIAALGSKDSYAKRRAEEALIRKGNRAVSALVAVLLGTNPPRVRQSACYILGRLTTLDDPPGVVGALGTALTSDSSVSVRMNCAIALGRIGLPSGIDALAFALRQEATPSVRSSIILALGSIATPEACRVLDSVQPLDEAEGIALRKASDRCKPQTQSIRWQDQAWNHPVVLAVPTGLEDIAIAEAMECGYTGLVHQAPGQVVCPSHIAPWQLIPVLRCIYGVRLPLGERSRCNARDPSELAETVGNLVHASNVSHRLSKWIVSDDDVMKYRFSIKGVKITRSSLRQLVGAVRTICQKQGLVDSPSNYALELVVELIDGEAILYMKPSFMPDTRFAYRKADVGASIHPVVAACLVRLLKYPGRDAVTVFDPTCGSGTLLIERALLGGTSRLVGMDISPTAVKAARTNAKAARQQGHISIAQGDARLAHAWPEGFDEVIANLPFGIRTEHEGVDIGGELYPSILGHVCSRLAADGRAVLYTTDRHAMEQSIRRHRSKVSVIEQRNVLAGGLWVHLWVLERR